MRVQWLLYLSRDSHQELYILYKRSGSILSVYGILHLLKCQQNKISYLVILTHLLNKQIAS